MKEVKRTQRIEIKWHSEKRGNPDNKDVEKSGNSGATYGDYFEQIDQLSLKCRNLYNQANYIVRKEFISTSKEKEQGSREYANWIRYADLEKICRELEPYNDAPLNCYYAIQSTAIAQHTLKILDRNWKSFFAAIKDWAKNPEKYTGKPSLPNYKKGNDRIVVEMTTNNVKNKDGYVFFCTNFLKNLNNTFQLLIKDAPIYSARFVPKGGDTYVFEITQKVEAPGEIEKAAEQPVQTLALVTLQRL